MSSFPELDPKGIKSYLAAERTSLVASGFEAKPLRAGLSMAEFLGGLPDVLKARDLLSVAGAIVKARQKGRPVIVMFGGHVIKCGCMAVLLGLARDGFITHFASNGAAAIHDSELALWGRTSEDVAQQIEDGSFGMASDTAEALNSAAVLARDRGDGLGETLGDLLEQRKAPHRDRSVSVQCRKMSIAYTIHVAMGTDIVHQHPSANGAAIGESSLRDFRIFAAATAELRGGVIVNLGSAVIMPEVFLKALSLARNLGHQVRDFTAVNMDMIQHYRPNINVVSRPVLSGGKGYSITGHHEIMIPLLAAAICEIHAGRLNVQA